MVWSYKEAEEIYFRVAVLLSAGIQRVCEHGYLHLGHQRVIDGGICQSETIWWPPVSDVTLEDLLCEHKQMKHERVKHKTQASLHTNKWHVL